MANRKTDHGSPATGRSLLVGNGFNINFGGEAHDVGQIYQMLNWKNPPEIQARGMELAEQIADLSLLIQPPADASVWECCAEILARKTDEELYPYLMDLMRWLEDLNWPGALTIQNRLIAFSGEKLKQPFMDSVASAEAMQNHDGEMWRSYLSGLLENKSLRAGLPVDFLERIKNRRYRLEHGENE